MGSGVTYEVRSALDTMGLIASKHARELVSLSSHINGIHVNPDSCISVLGLIVYGTNNNISCTLPGILDYLEGFNVENLHKVQCPISYTSFWAL